MQRKRIYDIVCNFSLHTHYTHPNKCNKKDEKKTILNGISCEFAFHKMYRAQNI